MDEDKDTPKTKSLREFYEVKKTYDNVAIREFGSSTKLKQDEVHAHVKEPLMVGYAAWQRERLG